MFSWRSGDFSFDVRAVDSTNDSAVATFQITINAASTGGGGGGGDSGGCSTDNSNGLSIFALLGLLSLLAISFRFRGSKA